MATIKELGERIIIIEDFDRRVGKRGDKTE